MFSTISNMIWGSSTEVEAATPNRANVYADDSSAMEIVNMPTSDVEEPEIVDGEALVAAKMAAEEWILIDNGNGPERVKKANCSKVLAHQVRRRKQRNNKNEKKTSIAEPFPMPVNIDLAAEPVGEPQVSWAEKVKSGAGNFNVSEEGEERVMEHLPFIKPEDISVNRTTSECQKCDRKKLYFLGNPKASGTTNDWKLVRGHKKTKQNNTVSSRKKPIYTISPGGFRFEILKEDRPSLFKEPRTKYETQHEYVKDEELPKEEEIRGPCEERIDNKYLNANEERMDEEETQEEDREYGRISVYTHDLASKENDPFSIDLRPLICGPPSDDESTEEDDDEPAPIKGSFSPPFPRLDLTGSSVYERMRRFWVSDDYVLAADQEAARATEELVKAELEKKHIWEAEQRRRQAAGEEETIDVAVEVGQAEQEMKAKKKLELAEMRETLLPDRKAARNKIHKNSSHKQLTQQNRRHLATGNRRLRRSDRMSYTVNARSNNNRKSQ